MIDNIGKTTYGYDNIYQLTSVAYPDRPAASYTYDPVGNRLSITVGPQTTTYTYRDNNSLKTAGTETFQYDGNGNMANKMNGSQDTGYTYDTQNHLIQVNLPNGTKSIFGYDYTGMRISDTETISSGNLETKQFLWDGDDVINEESPKVQISQNIRVRS